MAWPAGFARAADRGADGTFEQRSSTHFALYQDVDIDESGGFYGSRRFEQEVLAELERAFESLDHLLGLRPARRIDVVIYDPAAFDRQFEGLFRFQAAGFYHGVIRIRGATRLTDALSRVLHHELVHAALDAAAPALIFPGWVNEGGAEWFEARALGKRGLSGGEAAALARLSQAGALLPLQTLNTASFAQMGGERAQIAYLQSYALIEHLTRSHGERKLPQFYAELIRTRNLDRALERTYRLDAAALEARFLAELR
ncbi:MAG: hypothetical protein OEW02_09165 [Myxococcales bacterium]|nr:hypothetical protein [Myxococcales bacterium]